MQEIPRELLMAEIMAWMQAERRRRPLSIKDPGAGAAIPDLVTAERLADSLRRSGYVICRSAVSLDE